ncbi:MAG: hypothetical protein ACKO8G_00705 [Actinomycetota bacterium]
MLLQIQVSPNASPTLNSGGWVYGAAVLLAVVGVVIALVVVFSYLRYAPRFETSETGPKAVRAPRLRPGSEAPRRPVNVTGAPVVVPPPVAAAVAAAPAPVAAAAPAAPAAAAPAPAAVAAPAPAPAAAAPAVPDAAPAERHEVALDQETFDRTLAELLAKGTDRRVAEGQARRAAMIAARKKAGA